MAWHTVTPLIALYESSLGASPTGIGLVVSTSVMLPLFFGVAIGGAVDSWGARRVSRHAAVLLVGAFALLTAGRGVVHLMIALAVLGLADFSLTIATQAAITSLSRPEVRDQNVGCLTFWMSGGGLLGPILGGSLADLWGFRAAFAGGLALSASWS
jgi:MFS family permease